MITYLPSSIWKYVIAETAGRPRGQSSSPGAVKNFRFSISSRPDLGPTQFIIQWILGKFYQGVKRTGREADHSPPNIAEVKKPWIHTSTSLMPSRRSA
jgi:hypothetical protein